METQKTKTLIENNRLIAEFLGVTEKVIIKYNEDPKIWSCSVKYHSSWDWLMPVVKKCLIGEAEHDENISLTIIKNIYDGICNQNINDTYNSCVEFIKWYNKNN